MTRTAKTAEEPPVQVSAADSWGCPDIDLFLSVRCRPPTPRCVTDALSDTDAAQRGFTPTHARRGHASFTVSALQAARSQTEFQGGSPLSKARRAASLSFWKSSLSAMQ